LLEKLRRRRFLLRLFELKVLIMVELRNYLRLEWVEVLVKLVNDLLKFILEIFLWRLRLLIVIPMILIL